MQGSLDHQLYSQITFRWHNAYLGIVMVYDATDAAQRIHCRLAWATTALGDWLWVDEASLGNADFIPLGADGAFDSHVCFAAASPVRHKGEERVYFMGGNGPHFGVRNSSLGVGTIRKDRFASIRGSGTLFTTELLITASWLTVTADVDPDGGSVMVGLRDLGEGAQQELHINKSVPLTFNGTDVHMAFEAGCVNFDTLVGQRLVLEARLWHASLFTIGFSSQPSLHCCGRHKSYTDHCLRSSLEGVIS